MQIERSDEQRENPFLEINESFEPDSNFTTERALHFEKQLLQIVSTEEGMQIERSDLQPEKTDRSNDETCERPSNVTPERVLHCEMH
jgi:hypothetical protein